MAVVFYSARALADLDRVFDLLVQHDSTLADTAAALIVDAIAILERHPNIGRPARGDLRELVISQGRIGYVALYHVTHQGSQVEILALRHQREAGFG